MPPRAAPGNRVALEGALSPLLRGALAELREVLDLFDWQASPAGPLFAQAAVVLEASRLVAAGTHSEKDALDAAAIALGVSCDTVRSRARRWPVDSRSL